MRVYHSGYRRISKVPIMVTVILMAVVVTVVLVEVTAVEAAAAIRK